MTTPLADQGAQGAHFDGQGSLVKLPEPEQKPKPMAMDQLFFKLGQLYPQDEQIHTALVLALHEDLAFQFLAGQAANQRSAKLIFNGKALAGGFDQNLSTDDKDPSQGVIKFGDRFIYLKYDIEYTVSHCVGPDQTLAFRTADIDDHILVDNKALLDPTQFKRVDDSQTDEIKVGDQFRCLASGQIFTICEMVTDGPLVVVCCNGTTHRFSSGSALKEACLYERLTPEQQIDDLMTREGD